MDGNLSINPIRKERVSQQVALEICRLIREGHLRPGDSLPGERELARELEVSRASLREALRGLEISGIVETRHGGGTYVRALSPFGVESPLAMVLETSHGYVSDLWEVRRIVEPAFAERAAVRATPEGVDMLRRMLVEQEDVYLRTEQPKVARGMDREFHGAVARLSGNEAAEQVIQLLNSLVHQGYFAGREFIIERRKHAYECHMEIYQAIKERDPLRARASMLAHLEAVEEYILAELMDERDEENGLDESHVDSNRTESRAERNGGTTNSASRLGGAGSTAQNAR